MIYALLCHDSCMTMENGCFLCKDIISSNVSHDISSATLYGLVDIHSLYGISFNMFHDPFFSLIFYNCWQSMLFILIVFILHYDPF